MTESNMIRLQKFMALAGIASRRKCEEIILSGKVKVNGTTVVKLGTKINPDKDEVKLNGKIIKMQEDKVYIMLNKPTGYVTTVSDQFNRPTVIDLIKKGISQRVYPVGRLDYDTEGLLILTNDGDFTYTVAHPKHEIEKVYIAMVKNIPTEESMKEFRQGLNIEGKMTAPSQITILKKLKNKSKLKIIIHEGRNRQVRKMCDYIGCPVVHLKRVAIGKVLLGNLPLGKWRHLNDWEVRELIGK